MSPSKSLLLSVLAVALCASNVFAATFIVDPAKGRADGDGSAANPWRTLEEVASSGRLTGKVKGGDTVLLMSGYHGSARWGGKNEEWVTIAAAPEQTPTLSKLEITQGSKWRVRGLTISTSFSEPPTKGTMVRVAEGGESTEIIVEDCFIYSVLDASKWGKEEWMSAPSGILMGRHGKNITLRNNHVLNTRFAINLCSYDSLCEANLIENFSADGIRVTRDGLTVQYNVVKNAFVSMGAGDPNHDDGIQCFLFNKGTGTVRNITLRKNIVINREDDQQPLQNTMQAIGFFDGPLVDFLVEGNVVEVEHWHGVSLYDAQNCKILDNVAYTRWTDKKPRPWVMLGTKLKLAKGNVVKNNYAHAFNFKADAEVQAENNQKVTKEIFDERFAALAKEIGDKFGPAHCVSLITRIGHTKVDPAAARPQANTPADTTAAKGDAANPEKAPAALAQAAPVAAAPTTVLGDDELKAWHDKLLARLQQAFKEKQQPTVFLKLFGEKAEKVKLTAADEKGLTVVVQGNPLPHAWEKVNRTERFNLARAVLNETQASDLALAAVWAAAAEQHDKAMDYLAKARLACEGNVPEMVASAQELLNQK